MTHKERKYINNIPKFDLGHNLVISGGNLSTVSVDPSKFSATAGYSGYDTAALSILTPSTLSKIANYTTTGMSLMSPVLLGWTSTGVATAKNLATAGLSKAAAEGAAAGTGKTVSQVAAEEAAAKGGSVATAGLSTAAGIAGIGAGLYTAFSGFNDYSNAIDSFQLRVKDTDMVNGASTSTLTKFGRAYKLIGGFDESGILNLTNEMNTAGVDTATTAASTAGMGIGSAVGTGTAMALGASLGSIGGPLVALGGALLGGLFGGLFGSSSAEEEAEERMRKVKQDIANAKEAIGGYNTESEAEAGSAGLRDMYNASHSQSKTGILNADKGKNLPHFVNGKPVTFNPADTSSKKIQGKASPDETWLNTEAPLMEKVGYFGSPDPKVQDKRIDNINLYGDIDPVRIAGHDEDAKINNKYIATLARPAGKEAERIKEEYKETTDPNKKAQLEDRMRFLDKKVGALLDILEDMQNRDNMKHQLNYKRMNGLRKFADGKSDDSTSSNWFSKVGKFMGDNTYYLPAILGAVSSYANLNDYLNWINSQQPLMLPSSYVDAGDQSYVNALSTFREDPSPRLREMNDIARLMIYATRQAGGQSDGQKVYQVNNALNKLFASRGEILADYAKRNIGYKQAWAQAGIQARQNAATRAQQALSEQYKQYAQATGAYNNIYSNMFANRLTLSNSIMQALSTANSTKGMMNLYNQQFANNVAAINTGRDTKGNTTSWTPTADRFLSPVQQYRNWVGQQNWNATPAAVTIIPSSYTPTWSPIKLNS